MAKKEQDFEMWAGDHKELKFTVEDVDNLISCSIRWKCSRNTKSDPLIIKRSDDGDITTNENVFTVLLEPADTADLYPGIRYVHEAEMVDTFDNITTVAIGRMFLHPTII